MNENAAVGEENVAKERERVVDAIRGTWGVADVVVLFNGFVTRNLSTVEPQMCYWYVLRILGRETGHWTVEIRES